MRRSVVAAVVSAVLVVPLQAQSSSHYEYREPERINDGIPVGSVEGARLHPFILESAVQDLRAGEYGEVHSLLVYRDGILVLEEYFPGYDYQWERPGHRGAWTEWNMDSVHNVHSVGKSITATCIGIAIELGLIASVQDSIFDYLPEYQHLRTAGKDRISIENLLTMTSGLEWDEWGSSYSERENDLISLWFDCADPIAAILSKSLVADPGTRFTYSGANSILLGEIIRNASGMDIGCFAAKQLFTPLGIPPPEWVQIGDTDVLYAAGDQRLRPRDLLKIGVLYLQGGFWGDDKLLPEFWLDRSDSPYSGPENRWRNSILKAVPPGDDVWGVRGYSYGWWTHTFLTLRGRVSCFWALGWGGQRIAVFPHEDTVVVMTGGNYNGRDPATRILRRYIVRALE